MFTFTVFKIMLFEVSSVLSLAQAGTGNERVNEAFKIPDQLLYSASICM